MYTVCRIFTFAAAHKLPRHGGECRNLHGHTYKMEVEVRGTVNQDEGPTEGMIIDFTDLGTLVKRAVVDRWDHVCLNDLEEFHDSPPTAENMVHLSALRIAIALRRTYNHTIDLCRVRIWESPNSYVEWRL